MPRKTNGLPFETYPSPNKDENGQNLLFAKPARSRKMTLEELETFCAETYSFRNGEIARAFQAFIKGTSRFMSQGYTIETPIGIFEPKLAMKRQITNPDEVTHDDVEFDGIQFKASKTFKKEVRLKISDDGYRYVRKTHSNRLIVNEEQLLKALEKSIKANNGHTTVASFIQYSGLTDYSARKVLSHWCYGENPRLKASTYGRTTIYTKA